MSGLMSMPGIRGPRRRAKRPSWFRSDSRASPASWVLHLDGDLAAVVPDGAVDLPYRCGCRGLVLELLEVLQPVVAEPFREDGVDRLGGHRGRGFLEFGQRGAVRARDLLGEGGFEDGHGLPELHGAALELSENLEELVRRALLQFPPDDLGRLPADPFA